MTSLLMLSDQAIALRKIIEEHSEANDGDITDVEGIIDQWWNESTENIEAKVEACARLIRDWSATEEARKKEADKIYAAAAEDRRRTDRLKTYVKLCLDRAGVKKVQAGPFAVTVQKNGGVKTLEIDCSFRDLPKKYQIETIAIVADSAGIRKAIESGDAIPGCRLLDRGTSLRIK